MKRSRLFATIGWTVGTFISGYFNVIRPWHIRWGANDDEVKQLYPGDDLIAKPKINVTHAITIHAPTASVWPWLVQLGWGRGGWYSYTSIENRLGHGFRNADQIIPDYQSLKVGDTIPVSDDISIPVVILEPGRALVMHGDTRLPAYEGSSKAPFVKAGDYLCLTWGFYLHECGDGSVRLIERWRADYNNSLPKAVFNRLFLEPGAFIMERAMLLGIKQRAERLYQGQEQGEAGVVAV